MTPHETVFVPDQAHHQNVEDGKHDQPGSVRKRETVELLEDEYGQDNQGCWVRPEPFPQQTDDQQQFHSTMA